MTNIILNMHLDRNSKTKLGSDSSPPKLEKLSDPSGKFVRAASSRMFNPLSLLNMKAVQTEALELSVQSSFVFNQRLYLWCLNTSPNLLKIRRHKQMLIYPSRL